MGLNHERLSADKERLIANLQLWAVQNYMTQFDYVVIGAGSAAGCVVANRLTEEDPETVLLLEGNGYQTRDSNPSRCLKLLGSEVDWGYL